MGQFKFIQACIDHAEENGYRTPNTAHTELNELILTKLSQKVTIETMKEENKRMKEAMVQVIEEYEENDFSVTQVSINRLKAVMKL